MAGRTTRTIAVLLASVLALTGLQAAPAAADTIVTIPDAAFRKCLLGLLHADNDAALTQSALSGLTRVSCYRSPADQPIKDLTGAEYLTGATVFVLTSQELADVSPLASLTALKAVDIRTSGLKDASPLGALTGLSTLVLGSNPITDLSFVARLQSLGVVDLRNVPADPAPLASVPTLKWVYLGRNSTTDYSFLSDLPSVTRLTIEDNTIQELGSLGHPANLTSLYLTANELTELSSLSEVTSLHSLYVHATKNADIAPLAALTQLTQLRLSSSRVADLQPLAGLTGLTDLSVSGSPVTDLSAISGLTGLVTLGLSEVHATALPDLGRLDSLTTLTLSSNQLADASLTGLDALRTVSATRNKLTTLRISDAPKLESVDATGNQLSELRLTNLPALTEVTASWNALASTSGLSELPKLTRLALPRNQLTELAGLDKLPALAELDFYANQLTDLAPLAALPLTSLRAPFNKVTHLPVFTNADHLATLDLSWNELVDVSALALLWSLTDAKFTGNHIADLSVFSGSKATVHAEDQTILAAREVMVGVPIPIPLRGPDGGFPDIRGWDVTVADGTLTYSLAGEHQMNFSQAVGDSSFSGTFTQTAVALPDFTDVTAPVLTGTPFVGLAMQVDVAPWTPTVDIFSYQWYREGTAIPGATGTRYIPTEMDVGHWLAVSVTGSRHGYNSQTISTTASASVIYGPFTPQQPRLVGEARTGEELSIAMDPWSTSPETFTYRWYRNHHLIRTAIRSTYTLTAGDLGKRVWVRVKRYLAGVGTATSASKKTSIVKQGPVHASIPIITGTPVIGQRLGFTRGAWGPGKLKFRYTWRRDGHTIARAHKSTYRLTRADAGHQITVAVRGDRSSYTAVTRVSSAVVVPS